ncbi:MULTISPECIES: P-type conjugative transfer protein TrbJ [Sphingopyxis]|jgi:P-type conjugative transfer protein TrbJ|uniref:Conjugal transfer protein TrbJ n=2 Tax=Sphingopyxis TaxID=165697 RepID=A0AAC8YZG2_SPHMC|nr:MULTISPECIES: P-type conjugative transfer protein TrbJ [Sphingopyxis]ALJ13392.1 conjugal transfer protein TrbJ [Sphingopyxis macrogoltabida]AMU89145.1 conjugal transfer protein TrbJ [Sphingopyxis macrogoltabida]USI79309.1 P-type conjugative transfer protein TrbJ [Sphingopyxis sp. USTB-05]
MKKNILRSITAAALVAASVSGPMLSAPASAQVGGIVHDPRNYSQNILTAARTLEQINNQIKQLQNQATSLLNEARNLQSLPTSTLGELQAQIDQTKQLLTEAEGIAYDVADIRKGFEQRYKGTAFSGPTSALVANAEARWKDSVGAFEDAMKVQAGIVSNMGGTRTSISTIVGASQSATGALQAAQAGNQLLAIQSQQIADLAAVMTAQGRAEMLGAARAAAAEAEGRERFRRFRKGD